MTKLDISMKDLLQGAYDCLVDAHTKRDDKQDSVMRVKVMADLKAALDKMTPKVQYAWECTKCGSQEYTTELSEYLVHSFNCDNCGGDKWHKAVYKD